MYLGQDPEISKLSGEFALWTIPGLFPYLVNRCLLKYLQAQGIMKAGLYIMLLASPINAFLQWFLVWSPVLNLGPIGAPIAGSITNTLIPLLTILYTWRIDGYQCWGGWEWKEALDLRQIWVFIKLGIPGPCFLYRNYYDYGRVVGI